MKSEWIDIEDVELWERNPRINAHVVEQLALSIAEFGFLNPLIVQRSSGKIIAGNTRYKAATKLKLLKVPVIYADLTDEKAKAFAIADNKLGELAMWDDDLLKELLMEINEDDLDIKLLGFDNFELDSILNDTLNESEINMDDDIDVVEDNAKQKITIECPFSITDEIRETITTALMGYNEITIK